MRNQRVEHANNNLFRQASPQHQTRTSSREADDTISVVAASVSANAGAAVGAIAGIDTFPQDFNKIQLAAARLVAIQEMAKRKGSFSEEDNKIYASSLLELGQAAQNLALLQQNGQIKDFSVLLNPDMFGMDQKQPFGMQDQKVDEQKLDEVNEQQLGADDFLPPNSEDPYEDVNDSVAIMAPKKDASVAEAKPVGLSIAGEGGVASSKPNAVALSGRNGLAVASPKATAIAGVSPEEAAAFSISLPSRNQLVIKTPNSAAEKSGNDDYDYYSELPAPKPKRPSATRLSHGAVKLASRGGDPFVSKWRTAIAEDYASASNGAGGTILLSPRRASMRRPMLHHL